MKKTLTVNLGGTVYHIDEDAYLLLDNYLANLKLHFHKEEGADEIVKDIELRISELFSERTANGYQVVTIDYVEEVISRMGKPEELSGGEDAVDQDDCTKQKSSQSSADSGHTEQVKHRLYRNPNDKILGGVAGGLAAYMGWDTTWVRIVLILLLFVPYFSVILIYIVCWILIPLATTAAEKLSMKGENITVENIGKTVTDGFEKVAGGVNSYIHSGKPRSALQKFGDVFVQVIGAILKVMMIIIAIVLSPALFVLVIVFIALIFGAFGMLTVGPGILIQHLNPAINWAEIGTLPMALFGISGVLLVGIPLVSLVYMAFRSIFHWKPMANGWKWVLLLVWIFALAGIIGFCWWASYTIPEWVYIL